MINLITFITIFGYISNWKRFQFLPQALFNPKRNLKPYPNSKLVHKLSKQLGVTFQIKVQNSPIINGYMPGTPNKPVMILMQGALDKLTNEELEWMILHEAGHCLKWHTVRNTLAWILFLLTGIYVIHSFNFSTFFTSCFALSLAILWIQFERFSEVEADRYALEKGADPKAMISFFHKVNRESTNIIYKNQYLGLLLSSHPNYLKRIAMANTYRK